MNNNNLENYKKRLHEILDEIGEIGAIFENSSNEKILNTKGIIESANKLRVPGYRAYYLAQEGLALINLIAVSILNDKEKQKEFGFINEVEEHFIETLKNMEKFKSLDGKDVIEKIIKDKKADAH